MVATSTLTVDGVTAEQSMPDRALPQWAIDSLIFGMPTYTSAPKLWGKAVSIAMCMQARGWSESEFITEFMSRTQRKNKARQKRYANHKLWEQIQAYSKHGNSGLDEIKRAWAAAKDNLLACEGLTTPEELLTTAIEAASAWETRLEEAKDCLSVTETSVMLYVVTEIERRRMARVTCPCRSVAEFANVPPTTALRTLKALSEKGFLNQFSGGTYSKNPKCRKAAIYGLADPFTLRVGGRVALSPKPMASKLSA